VTGVLLDTGSFVYALLDDPRLPGHARARIEAASRVAVSAISFYEIGQKARLGKWPEIAPFVAELVGRAFDDGFHLLPLGPEVAAPAATLDWAHRDPFDRLIAATCLAEDAGLVSPDAAFDAIGVRRVWA
jgi:PIN domain nuclease of toxin-antitoxin system